MRRCYPMLTPGFAVFKRMQKLARLHVGLAAATTMASDLSRKALNMGWSDCVSVSNK